jgi:hypothetical protein
MTAGASPSASQNRVFGLLGHANGQFKTQSAFLNKLPAKFYPLGEQTANSVNPSRMARRPDSREEEMLSKENLSELRQTLAHLSLPAVRDFYEQSYRDCRLIYSRIPSPRQIQTLVQVWKQLWKWR